jgi:hypothetical protein
MQEGELSFNNNNNNNKKDNNFINFKQTLNC